MNTRKILGAAFAVSAIALAGCSGSGSSSSASNPGTSPKDVTITASTCATEDAATLTALAEANVTSNALLETFAKNGENLKTDSIKSLSATAKAQYSAILAKTPTSCGAQLGYALAILASLSNNSELNSLYTAVKNEDAATLFNVNTESYATTLMKTAALAKSSNTLVTERVQNLVAANVLPALDSAISLMQNVVKNNYTFTFAPKDNTIKLDNAQFAPALGAMFFAKAAFTIVAGLDLDASKDNSYEWVMTASDINMLDSDSLSAEQKASIDQAAGLLSANSPFTTVRSAWKTQWASIPAMLDSAAAEVEAGLETSYAKYSSGTSQADAPYIVGNGEDADISPEDLLAAIDTVKSIRKYITGTVTVQIKDIAVDVNLSKFFTITDGFQDLLPYHKITDASAWFTLPEDESFWSSDIEAGNHFALAKEIVKTYAEIDSFDVHSVKDVELYVYYNSSEDGIKKIEIDVDTKDDYKYTRLMLNDCNYSFTDDTTKTYTLSADVCKDSSGVTYYRQYKNVVSDVLVFTDKSGNETIHAYKLLNDKADGSVWTAAELASYVIFPDPTFNGVFPGMTQTQLWNVIFALK